MKNDRPEISSLENPLYYLENFRTVISWVRRHHADLLNAEELKQLTHFDRLYTAAQGLLARLVMRSGDQFRAGKLSYPELGVSIVDAASELCDAGWLDAEPMVDINGLFKLFTRAELKQMLSEQLQDCGLAKTASKRIMHETMAAMNLRPAPLSAWSPGTTEIVLEMTADALFERVRLMFFGNLRQDWTEFVLSELGHQRYEEVAFSAASRAFQQRAEVDRYLHLAACREALELGALPAVLYELVPQQADTNTWLEERRGRLLFALGHAAERQGELELALGIYAQSNYGEALVRRLRVMERMQSYEDAYPLVRQGMEAPKSASQQVLLERIHLRLCKKLALAVPKATGRVQIPAIELVQPWQGDVAVEQVAAEALMEEGGPVFYVENWLFNGLFALLCWPALYAPLKGAFFHPFHAGPTDLYRDGFVERRQVLFDECLSALRSNRYRRVIRDTYQQKRGISSYFMHWELLNEEVLELALEIIPAAHLNLIFEHMLKDLRSHRAGLPDLIKFDLKKKNYQLIEVKGPGDRLQDNQRSWFEFFLAHQIPAYVCHLTWAEQL